MIDELAYAANMDPVAFRLAQMNDDRWVVGARRRRRRPRTGRRSVAGVEACRTRTSSPAAASRSRRARARCSAVIADVEVNKKTGKIVVKHMYASQDAGLSIYVSGSESQMTGGVIQSVSRALSEAVTFNKTRVTSLDWATYPLLRFKDTPGGDADPDPAARDRAGRRRTSRRPCRRRPRSRTRSSTRRVSASARCR